MNSTQPESRPLLADLKAGSVKTVERIFSNKGAGSRNPDQFFLPTTAARMIWTASSPVRVSRRMSSHPKPPRDPTG